MRISSQIIMVASLIFLGLYMQEYSNEVPSVIQFNSNVDTLKSHVVDNDVPEIKKPKFKGKLNAFLNQIGKTEGFGSYETVSRSGYLGMYQFHPTTLSYIGIDVTPEEFLMNPALQDSVMILYMKMNAKSLNKVIEHYSGKYVNGVYVTKAGILAGAHLVGPGGVLAFFRPDKYDYKTVDGNGVHVSTYMTKFAGYDLRGL